jgi:hypothetical protein
VGYARRKRWEARIQAVEIGRVIAQMFGSGETEQQATEKPEAGRISADAMLKLAGAHVEEV